MDWSYTKFPPNYFLVIAAGVPYTEYSAAKTKGGRNTENADAIVRRTLHLQYFNPNLWWIENPRYGSLGQKDFM